MSYIGNQSENKVSPARMREYVTGDGSATTFDLSHDIPGYGAENLIVVVNNVIQEPASAYTIKNDANGRPRRLDFGAGNVLATTDTCYVIYQATGQIYHTPPANSVGYSQLEANLRSGRVDQFAGSAGASSNTVFTLTETALNANSIMVYVNGIYQRPTTNYTVSGTALTFTASLADTDEVDVHHMSIRSTVTRVADGSVTSAALDDNLTLAGTLTTVDILPTADNTSDLGSTSKRWANIYTTDLHLNNDRGDWTIIEEEEYLSLRNNKNGKMYKFVLQEIEEKE